MKPTLEQLQQQINDLRTQLNTLSVQSQISYDSENAFRKRLDTPESGVYTPTFTNDTNVDSSTAAVTRYIRIGKIVIVAGKLTIDPTTGSAVTRLGISLPISSRFASSADCSGTMAAPTIESESGTVIGDTTSYYAQLTFRAVSTAPHEVDFIFMYQII